MMSFWKSFGLPTVTAIDTLLDEENCTLQQLLDEDDILQETKSQNKKLLDFLSTKENLTTLVSYITQEAEDEPNTDNKRKFKFPFLACEILASEVWQICNSFYEHEELLESLYGFLQRPPQLPPQLATYTCRVAISLLQKKVPQTIAFLKKREGMISHFVKHLGNPNVMELLLKIISCEDTTEGTGTLQWLSETDLIENLISNFNPTLDYEKHENAQQALVDIINVSSNTTTASSLIMKIESDDILNRLFEFIFVEGLNSSLLHGITVLIELLRRHMSDTHNSNLTFEELPSLHKTIIKYLPKFKELARTPPLPKSEESKEEKESEVETKPDENAENNNTNNNNNNNNNTSNTSESKPNRPLEPLKVIHYCGPVGVLQPLGFHRLKIVELFAALANNNIACVDKVLMDEGIIKVCLDLFFEYKWNNFLHSTVFQILATILEGDNDAIRKYLIIDCEILDRIVQASDENEQSLEKSKKAARRGYMGHITNLTQTILLTSRSSEEVENAIKNSENFRRYQNGAYAAIRERQDKNIGGHKPSGMDYEDFYEPSGEPSDNHSSQFSNDFSLQDLSDEETFGQGQTLFQGQEEYDNQVYDNDLDNQYEDFTPDENQNDYQESPQDQEEEEIKQEQEEEKEKPKQEEEPKQEGEEEKQSKKEEEQKPKEEEEQEPKKEEEPKQDEEPKGEDSTEQKKQDNAESDDKPSQNETAPVENN